MNEFYWIAVAVVSITSAARFTRLLVFDKFPPVKYFRDRYDAATTDSDWQALSYCPYCMAPWVSIVIVLVGYLTDFPTAWWLVNSIAGASYLAAILVMNDGDHDEQKIVLAHDEDLD